MKAAHPVCSSPSVCSPSLRYSVHNIPLLGHIQSQMKPFCSCLSRLLYTCMHLVLPRDGPSDFAAIILQAFLISTMSAMCPANLVGVTNLIPEGTVEIMKPVSLSLFPFSPSLPLSQVQIFRSEPGQVDTMTVLQHRNRILCAQNRPDHSHDPPSLLFSAYLRLFLRRYNGRGVKLIAPSRVPSLPLTSADYIVTKEFRVLQAPPSPCTLTRVSPSASVLWCSGRTQSQTHLQREAGLQEDI